MEKGPRQTEAPQPEIVTDLFDDSLPLGAISRLGTTRFNHRASITSIAFAPDGKTLASAGKVSEGKGHLWDSASDRPVYRWYRGTDKVIRLWDRATGREILQFRGHEEAVRHIAFSPNGKTLASASEDKTVRLWDVTFGKQLRVFQGSQKPVFFVVFSPDGKTLATSDWVGQIRLWTVATGEEVRRIDERAVDGDYRLAFSPDGKRLFGAQAREQTLVQWDLSTGKKVRSIEAHKDYTKAITLSPDGRLLASTDGVEISLWEVDSWKKLWQLPVRTSAIVFSPDGKTIASHEGVIKLRRVDSGREVRQMRGREPTGANVLAFSPDGKTLVSDCDGNFIKLWATDTGEEILPKAGHESTVRCIAFSPDGRLIFSGGDDDTVRVWNAFTDRQIRRLREDPFDYSGRRMLLAISSLASSPSQQFLAGGSWGRVFLLGARTGTPTEVWSVPVEEYIQHIGFSSDGTTLAWGSDTESVYVVDVRPGAAPRNVVGAKAEGVGRRAPGFVLALSPDGKRLLYGQKSAPYICREVATGKELYKLAAPAVGLRDVSFLPDGKSLISVNVDDTIAVWDGSNGKELRSSKHGRNVRAARLSPDGKTLAIGNGDGTISLWDVNAGRERHQFAGHQAGVCCVAFAPNGKVLASGSEDGTVLVWDVEDPLGTKRPASADVDVLWDTLGGDDMAAVHRSIAALTTAARARPSLILERVRPMIRPEEGKCARLVALLDDERFETREKATTELAKLADLAEPALRRALAERPSPEVRQAVERLLIGLEEPGFSTRECRLQRAVEILERVGTDEARRALEEISKGAPGRWLRQLAKAAQARLEKR